MTEIEKRAEALLEALASAKMVCGNLVSLDSDGYTISLISDNNRRDSMVRIIAVHLAAAIEDAKEGTR